MDALTYMSTKIVASMMRDKSPVEICNIFGIDSEVAYEEEEWERKEIEDFEEHNHIPPYHYDQDPYGHYSIEQLVEMNQQQRIIENNQRPVYHYDYHLDQEPFIENDEGNIFH